MAPKRSAPLPPPPPPPAASDEETASGSGSEEEEEEEEIAYSPPPAAPKTMAPPPHAAPKTMSPPPQKGQESEDEDEDDEEEDDEEENTQVPPPLATKNPSPPPPNREESESSGEDEEEEEETDDEAPQPKPAPKQVAEGEAAKPSLSEDKKAGAPFQRIWSADDEVRILEAMAKHRREHGTLPQVEALAAMLDGTLDNSDRSVGSLQGKLRNMKRRYSSAANRGELPSKEHDRRVFDLSKAVWGSMTAAANSGARREVAEMRKLYPCLAEEVTALEKEHPGLFKREFGMIDDDKARALERKIKKHRLHQAKLNVRRGDVIKEVTKTLIDLSQEHPI